MKRVRFVVPITILLTISIVLFITGFILFRNSIASKNIANIFSALFALIACLVISGITSGVGLGLSIASIKKSSVKVYPIITTIICALILLGILIIAFQSII